jgi:hypothetical protein
MGGKPLWRRLFDAVDRRVAGPVEAGARSDAFGDLVTVSWRLTRRLQREAERRTRRLLHLMNLPTASDVRRLSEQVSALQRQLREADERNVPGGTDGLSAGREREVEDGHR